MSLRIKRLFVRLFIQVVKVGAVITYYSKRAFAALATPLKQVVRLLVRTVGVPLYRGVFFVRRFFARFYVPGKHKLMYLLTNRYSVHGLVILIVFSTMTMSVQASGVRSDDFGQSSILYGLVSDQQTETIVVRSDIPSAKPANYLGASVLSAQPDIDFIGSEEPALALATGGAAIIAPTISEASDSTAPRTEVVEYTVQSGDTLGTIAQTHGISITTLLWANSLNTRSVIQPGDTMKILPVDGVLHTVKSGDTVIGIARTYSADAPEIVDYNHLASSNDLRIGETLLVPGGERPAPAPIARAPVTRVFTRPSTPAPVTTTTSTAPVGASTGSGKMIWPTDLRVITQYYGWKHTGLDIDCHFTHDNYAADDGYVQYAGWKGGYGLTVEINHGNGIVTRYGHGAKNYVAAGQTVSKGDPIQLCGTTGRSTGTHLHFEVISNGKFKNPLEYIR